MQANCASFSKAGRNHENQDFLMPLIAARGCWWAVIADGMGGHEGGSVASRAAIHAIKSAIQSDHDAPQIKQLFEIAQSAIKSIAQRQPKLESMGTTCSLIQLEGDRGIVGHVGDSRIYHLRGEQLFDRTVDQTEVEQLIQHRMLTRAQAIHYPRRNVLLSALSATSAYELYQEAFPLEKGDRIVLLTDGVSSKVSRDELTDLSLTYRANADFCSAIASQVEQ